MKTNRNFDLLALYNLMDVLLKRKIKYPIPISCDLPSGDSHPFIQRQIYQAVMDKYVKRMPGIAIAIRDKNGLWLGRVRDGGYRQRAFHLNLATFRKPPALQKCW
ncbi:MAG: hypothetical protein IPL25_03585 [Saprospiraceae bacterium]|nr:hypothetical protein [Candidatus Vicinibacter affinis]